MSNPLHDILFARVKTALPRLSVTRQASWKEFTSSGTGQAPFFLTEPSSERELKTLLMVLREFSVSAKPLGAGTNFIGADRELSTVFLRLKGPDFSGIKQREHLLECGAAIRLSQLAVEAAKLGFGGLAPLCGIPGSLGGAVKMNAGANKAEISQFIRELKGISLADGSPYSWKQGDNGWAYRTSPIPQNVLITSVLLELIPVEPEAEQQLIQQEKARRAAVTPKGRSAGSTFRNPGTAVAGILLDQSGCKSITSGNVHVSGQHANWIISELADSPASEQDYLSVLMQMKQAVFRNYKINLQTELCFADTESERLVKEMDQKLKIVVLKGGTSSEREVSLISGGAVAEALRCAGHDVIEYDILKPEVTEDMRNADVVYPVLHGGFGEDGTLQKVMEEENLKFVGCPSQACIDAMDKVISKKIMEKAGIRSPKYFVTDSAETPFPEAFGLPMIVKPPCEGSTFGLTLVESPDQWKGALELALKHDKSALVEEYIEGVEATVSILDGKAMPLVEIRYPGKLYDYDAKYTHALGETEYICPPAGISEAAQKEAQELSLAFYHAVGARDMLRVDVIIGKDDRVWVLEGNTLPGCTPSSLLPKAAKAAGISFPEMCSSLAFAAAGR